MSALGKLDAEVGKKVLNNTKALFK